MTRESAVVPATMQNGGCSRFSARSAIWSKSMTSPG